MSPSRLPPSFVALAILATLALVMPGAHGAAGDTAQAALAAGTEALARNELPAAIEAFRRAAEAEPDNVDAWFKLGLAQSRAGAAGEAAAAWQRVVELDPGHAQAWNNLGNLRFREDDYAAAAEFYTRAIEADPDYLLALYYLGRIQYQDNAPDEAEVSFLRCITLTPGNKLESSTQFDCRFYLGALRFRAGNYEEAADFMKEVLRHHPGHLEARYYLGMAWLRLGRTEDGKEQLAIHRKMLDARRKDSPIEAPDGR